MSNRIRSFTAITRGTWSVLRPGVRTYAPTYAPEQQCISREHAASAIRSYMRDRFEQCIHRGQTWAVLNDLEEHLRDCGWSRRELLRALLEDLFPEDFQEDPEVRDKIRGMVPPRGCAGISTANMLAFVEKLRRAAPNDDPKSEKQALNAA